MLSQFSSLNRIVLWEIFGLSLFYLLFQRFWSDFFFGAMISHLLKYELFFTKQSGFSPGYSTQDVSLSVTDSWLKAIDDGVQ